MSVSILIDADPLVYACGFMGEEREWHVRPKVGRGLKRFPSAADRDGWLKKKGLTKAEVLMEKVVHPKPFSHCRQALRMSLAGIRENVTDFLRDIGLQYGREHLYLTGGTNYRLAVATIKEYKGNRVAAKPYHYKAIRAHMIHDLGADLTDGVEADDVVAMLQWQAWYNGDTRDTLIATIDKDLNQVPGLHYNYSTKEAYVLTEQEANTNFWRQVITGDATDNIPGCYKLGKAAALKLIPDDLNNWEAYNVALLAYTENMEKYPAHHAPYVVPRDCLIENARLLYMLRHPKDEWNPPEAP